LSSEEELRGHFRPEFLNRIDATVVFRRLDRGDLERIVEIQLDRLRRLLEDRQITLQLTSGARALIVEQGYDPTYGARPLKRVIQKHLQDPLAQRLLEGSILDGAEIVVGAGPDGLILNGEPIDIGDLVNTFTVRGLQHHFAMGQGDVTRELMEMAAWKKMRLVEPVPYADYLQMEGVNA